MRGEKPQSSVLKFVKWLKKRAPKEDRAEALSGARVLDLGCGEGKNARYFASLGARVSGIDISDVAIARAKEEGGAGGAASRAGACEFATGSIGEPLPFADAQFDIALDVTSSNALTERERATYLRECARVLAPGGVLFVRALCKDGDANAKKLLQAFPGAEKDTYIMPVTGLHERVFSEADIRATYGEYFDIVHLERETHYTTMPDERGGSRKYKRNFWILYGIKKI